MNQLTIKELNKRFGRHQILRELSLTLEDGIYGLLGSNGAGKTTLLKCIVGVYRTPSGTITFNENDANKKEFRNTIGYLPQHYNAFHEFSVEEMLVFYCKSKGIKKSNITSEVDSVIEKLNLESERKKKIAKLSGGMLRRTGIAQCLLGKPKLIIMDEPTVGLDVEEQIHIQTIISNLSKDMIIIISSHIVADLENVCDKIIVMNEGNIITCDTSEGITQHAQNKSYEIHTQALSQLDTDYMVVKTNSESLRIISPQKLNIKTVTPTLEEGYLCLVKGW